MLIGIIGSALLVAINPIIQIIQPAPAQTWLATTTETPGALIDEISSYVLKYYVDRDFNGVNWQTAVEQSKSKLADQVSIKKNEFAEGQKLVSLLGDKYSRLLSPELYAMLEKYDLVGVGAMLSPSQAAGDDGNYLVISSPPIKGTSADKAGLKKGDLVTSINGKSTQKMSAFDVIELTSTDLSPTMRFEVLKPNEQESKEYVLTRTFNKINDPVEYFLQQEKLGRRVGYIKLKEFNSVGREKVKEAIIDLEKQGADDYVLDLRGNGGGAFQSAISISSLFMDESRVVSITDGFGGRETFKSAHDQVVTNRPLVVWIDERSASASEVLSGALHDNCRATLVGSRSFGKGLVQAVYGLSDGSGLVLTVAKYETPKGTNINKVGIQPDEKIRPPLFAVPGLKPDLSSIDFEKAERIQDACSASLHLSEIN